MNPFTNSPASPPLVQPQAVSTATPAAALNVASPATPVVANTTKPVVLGAPAVVTPRPAKAQYQKSKGTFAKKS